MISKTNAFTDSNGGVHISLEDAQIAELVILINGHYKTAPPENEQAIANGLCRLLVGNRSVVVDILTTTPDSRPKARKVNGGTKKRKAPETTTTTPPAAG
jgi:hypothetical protein